MMVFSGARERDDKQEFADITRGVSAKANQNVSEMSTNRTGKILMPYYSLPLNQFDVAHRDSKNLVINYLA